MSKSNGLETGFLSLYFTAVAIPNIADNAAAAPATNLYVSLHTADPGEGGNQSTNEISYTGPYARVPVPRSVVGWTISGTSPTQATNAGIIQFAKCTGVADQTTALYWGIGRSPSGAGILDYSGPLGSSLGLGTGKASNDTVTIPGLSGAAVGDKVVAVAIPNGTIPAGITEGTVYFLKTVAGNDVTLSTTSGGSLLDITADGACWFVKMSGIVQVSQNIAPNFAAGTILVFED